LDIARRDDVTDQRTGTTVLRAYPDGVSGASLDAGRAERAQRVAALFERARDGDAAAMDGLVRELNPLLWHVVRAQGLPAEEAADAVQTVWLELIRRLGDIHTPQALTGWLVTTAKRQAWHSRAKLRRQPAEGAEALDGLADQRPEPAEAADLAERQRVLWRHIGQLSDRCRELLRIIAFVDRPDYTVVAEALDMPRGSIGPTRGRCLAKLRLSLLADPGWTP
jgi:RNA polymerase sigma factor (sigma-70 family)